MTIVDGCDSDSFAVIIFRLSQSARCILQNTQCALWNVYSHMDNCWINVIDNGSPCSVCWVATHGYFSVRCAWREMEHIDGWMQRERERWLAKNKEPQFIANVKMNGTTVLFCIFWVVLLANVKIFLSFYCCGYNWKNRRFMCIFISLDILVWWTDWIIGAQFVCHKPWHRGR